MGDRIFDDLAAKFARKIYQDKKGKIRLHILWRDYEEFLFKNGAHQSLNILDLGGGIGQVSSEFALHGHKVVHSEPSKEMIDLAREHASNSGVETSRIHYVQKKMQDHPSEFYASFDLILFHAVLEWLEDPIESLSYLLESMKPGATLSMMFYNKHSVVLSNLFKGNFRKAMSNELGGNKKSLTPINPIDPYEVYDLLGLLNFSTLCRSGMRVFNDYMPKNIREARSLEDTLEIEGELSRKPPYRDIARYIHVLAKAP